MTSCGEIVFRDKLDMVYRYSNILCFNLKLLPCQTDVQWEKMLSRILRNHLGLWRGTAVIRGTVLPERKMLVQHDMHSIPRHSSHLALLPRVSVALFPNRVPEIACLSNTTIIFRVRIVHTALLSLPLGNCLSCAYLSCHAGFNGTRWKITRDMLMTCDRCCPRL
jgi:hypothetical protein